MRSHGMYRTKEYYAWGDMKARCLNDRHKAYPRYGGRGISVCDRWLSFENFLEDMGPCPPGLTLERGDNDKGYEPSNCRWATRTDQSRNRRLMRNNPSGINGVRPFHGKWRAYIGIEGDVMHLGTFDTKEAAAERRAQVEREMWHT
jgi:hypothetical protein